ncbi:MULTISPECIES: sugar ABC transporter ATP-binding protein [Paraburkholderia]|uniref:Monosaccharide ABC transporter ATP-binding protein (CUT2 family) n=1 Tax=Paraburkholderia tropica TaxID=92647 RepID=A0A1A5X5P9_9BURK|nr:MULTISPECIES: sugar ABC transporter ATP-binding protein [Paraburkholderia]MBB2983471.1 ribose transport system ATP-binding protein [Paraburkholderia tropica]MBB3001095.1 ribose transport system ATP-binding protein [Paraburkholderia tropica]MBB6320727.1 ribose transport system ATP-binding protein [Paraburkholderia tropica]MDE1140824.1 sugar ABC transporter ATP-binding protein [Paraburkholderia tropica]OBR48470.1 D-xylose ABC transporter ATP-binding protein [Paraburkholderia tropica]
MSSSETTPPLLEMRGISKTFPGVRALDNVRLSVWPGEVHSLMGENGAGKSTLMKILSGAYQADPGGEILIEGKPVTIDGPLAARELGVAVIYQELSLAPNLSVAENIYAGRELRRGNSRFGMVDRAAMERGCEDVLQRLGATFGPTTLVGSLSIAERQLVEIARAVHTEARIIVMDEPTTPLSSRETERLFKLILQLREDGLAIIYISHRMAEIYELSDRVSVLRDGSYVGTLMRDALSAESLVSMMVGRDISGFYKKAHAPYDPGKVVLTVRDVADDKRVRGCSLDLHAGEVLGIAGLVGAGRTELARLIFGAEPRVRGEISIDGKTLHVHTPRDAINAGLVYLTEDRKHQGLFLDMSVRDNINVSVAGRDARFGVLDLARGSARAKESIRALTIRVPSPRVNVGALSGGNQQKVLLSRLLETKPRVLILDEPTRGVDIGAKSEIYRIINDLAKTGVGIIVISSELPEIIGVADRVLVMREGLFAGELGGYTGRPIGQEAIIELATGSQGALDEAA